MGPYYREINAVTPVYLYLGLWNRGVQALRGVFDSHLLNNRVHSLSLVQVSRFPGLWQVLPGFIFVNYGNTSYRLWKFFDKLYFDSYKSNKDE